MNILKNIKSTLIYKGRSTAFILLMLPTMSLLVGSCKTSDLSSSAYSYQKSMAFKEALFPSSSIIKRNADDSSTRAHRTYVSRARSIIQKDPESLMKLTKQEISFIFGEPTFARKDANARVWQYKTNNCVIDFYFYDERNAKTASPVSFVDMRFKEELYPGSASKGSVSTQEQSKCLQDVVAQSIRSSSRA